MPKRDDLVVKWTTTLPPKVLLALKKRSDTTDIPMSKIITRLLEEAIKRNWK